MKASKRIFLLTALSAFAVSATPQASAATLLVSESFGGTSGNPLNATTADTFASGITSAGGSFTWGADAVFKADGSGSTSSGRSAYLSIGSYINNAKGTATGKFTLQATLALPTGANWATIGFAAENAPNTAKAFNDLPTGGSSTTGVATMLYRTTGDIDQFAPSKSTNQVATDDVLFSGTRTLTITLDLTTAGGYNGTSNFGTVYFGADTGVGNAYSEFGSYTYTADASFSSILLSMSGTTSPSVVNVNADYASMTLTQIPEPSTALLGGLGLLALLRRRR